MICSYDWTWEPISADYKEFDAGGLLEALGDANEGEFEDRYYELVGGRRRSEADVYDSVDGWIGSIVFYQAP